METVLGVSMAPTAVGMVLVEGQNADGSTVDHDHFDLTDGDGVTTLSPPDQVIAAIMGTKEGAVDAGCQVSSAGVAWNTPAEAAALRDALADRRVENVMLVSSFLAAAALAHAVGNATGYAQTALLFVEPDTATLAVVNTADGSIDDVHRVALPQDDDEAVATLAEMVSTVDALDVPPDGVFVVGSGVDIPMIKPALDAATSLTVTTPEEPELALARGAALASANAPLFASSTAALAYAMDPGTGEVDPYALDSGILEIPPAAVDLPVGDQQLAYSALMPASGAYTAAGDDNGGYVEEDFTTGMFPDFGVEPVEQPSRQPFLTAISVMTVFVVGVVALVLSLAVVIRPHVAQRPSLSQNLVAPARQAPAPPAPQAQVPASPTAAPAPAQVPAAAPLRPPAPVRAAAPAPAPALVPAPAPVFVPPVAPLPVVPQLIPQIPLLPAPGPAFGGEHGGGGWGHGGPGIGIPHGGFGGGHGGFGGGHGHR